MRARVGNQISKYYNSNKKHLRMVKLRGVWQRRPPSWQTLEIEENRIFYLFKH